MKTFATNLGISLQIVVQDIDTDGKIASVEGIAAVPSLRTELPPFLHHSMEVTEGKQDALELCLPCTHLKSLLGEVVQGLVQVGLHSCWGFICDLGG